MLRVINLTDIFYKLALDISLLAQKVNLPLVTYGDANNVVIAAIEIRESEYALMGEVSISPNDSPLSPEADPNIWNKKLGTVWTHGSKATTAIYLFGAALYYAKAIVPDKQVSPAAQLVARRYYEKNKSSGLIVDDVLEANEYTKNAPWLRAGYINPGDADSIYAEAFDIGAKLNIDKQKLLETGTALFRYYISREDVTKRDSEKALSRVAPQPPLEEELPLQPEQKPKTLLTRLRK